MATQSSNPTSLKVNLSANAEAVGKNDVIGEKSLKSQRTYQVGVVFKDGTKKKLIVKYANLTKVS